MATSTENTIQDTTQDTIETTEVNTAEASATAKKGCSCCAPTADGSEQTAAQSAGAGTAGLQEARITVKGGYTPSTVRMAKGRPARLVFNRQEKSGCSEEIVIPAFGIRRTLPEGQDIAVEFTPEVSGTFPFTCGMEMLRGEIVVTDV
ncbi:MAG: cupredoxin domain-containing protein [Gemmatimonadaceae bacterium]